MASSDARGSDDRNRSDFKGSMSDGRDHGTNVAQQAAPQQSPIERRPALVGALEPAESGSLLVDARQVAQLLRCSVRHVRRLADRGAMPPPVKLGALARWSRSAIETWIAKGCPRLAPRRR